MGETVDRERDLRAARRVLVTTHHAARSALEPLRAACRRDPALRPLLADLERLAGQLGVVGTLGEHFATLAIARERHMAAMRRAWAELAAGER